ncbi:MAG: Ig-like domain-containing protein, partial [Muribaculaceae bacterium]|nr:Ig-like domain-containing protein [Muribaculaceae bacterium]
TDLELAQGKSAIIVVTVTKDDDMAVDNGYWSSSNPEVATVQNGLVTAISNGIAKISYTATDEYGLTHTASCTVIVANGTSSIAGVDFDESENVDIFSIHGVAVYRNVPADCLKTLSPGIYIVRQGSLTKKINL